MNQVLALVLTIVAVAAGQSSAWAAATFTVTNSGSTFTVTRSGNTAVSETVNYRTVSLSAIEGQHFTAASGTLAFAADETSKTVTVTEKTPGTDAYKYQTGSASRTYRFEVTDLGGYLIAYKDRSITSGLTQFSGAKVSSSVSSLVKMSSGNFTSDMSSSKYLDVTYTPPTSDVEATNKNNLLGYVLIDDEYDYTQKPATVSTSTLISSTGAPASYLNTLGYKIYATVCFTEREKDDGYQYLQIVAGSSSASYDTGADPNGKVNDPENSVYKVCFEFANGSNAEGKNFFPHRFSSNGEFSNSDGVQHEYKFKDGDNWKYDGSGAVILPVTTGSITTRFDAGGNNDDTWGYKDLFVRMALRDATAPTKSGDPVVAPGPYGAGTTVYISVPFSEIVTVSGTPYLHTDWGDYNYFSGSGSNVLTFSGTIPATFGATLITRSLSGTITDLAGNALASTDCYKQFSSITVALPWGGSGTQADPYVITRAAQLDYMATRVNANYGANSFNGKYFVLADDIAYTHTSDWDDATSTENNYTAIGGWRSGTTYNQFKGDFDGDGHTISGIRIYKPESGTANGYTGLFGYVGTGGSVHDVNLADARITGQLSVAGIAGLSYGTVTNCTVAADVLVASKNTNAHYHAGIVGNNHGTVSGCTSAVTLTAAYTGPDDYGAVVGINYSDGTVENCFAHGATIPAMNDHYGVIAGYNSSGTLTANYYRDCTVGSTANAVSVGCGTSSGAPADVDGARSVHALTLPVGVTASGESVDISSTTYYAAGTDVTLANSGSAPSGYVEPCYYSLDGTSFSGSTVTMPASDATVALLWTLDYETGHAGTAADSYIISDYPQLELLASRVNNGNKYSSGKFFKLGADIVCFDGENNHAPIGVYGTNKHFLGTFDGDGHTVSGIRISSTGNQGLFGYLSGATVKNVTLAGSTIIGRDEVGGIVGYSFTGTFENCRVLDDVTIKANTSSAYYHGGIVGTNDGGTLAHNYYYYECGVCNFANNVGTGSGDVTDNDGAVKTDGIPLLDNYSNDFVLTRYADDAPHDFTLAGRTLYRDGDWNTLCLPFPMSAAQVTAQLAPTALMTLESSSFADGTLTLNFENATEIVAGTPYIIKWPAADNLVSPTFTDVTIPDGYTDTEAIDAALATAAVSTTYADFRGTFAPVAFEANDRTKLYLGTANTLYYPDAAMTVGSFRVYFALNGLTAGDVSQARLYFGEDGNAGDPARIIAVGAGEGARAPHGWYTLDGRKLDSVGPVPVHLPKGLYIVNGKKIVIK